MTTYTIQAIGGNLNAGEISREPESWGIAFRELS
jgi:hypothetical protein